MSQDPSPLSLHRRELLKLACVAGVGLIVPGGLGCSDDPDLVIGGPVPAANAVPPQLLGELVDGVRVFELEVQNGKVEWVQGSPTPTFGINGPVLGPTMRFRRGERVRINVKNTLSETTTLHWHGVELPAKNDGGPYQTIKAGETWSTEFDVVQRSLMAWYHPHRMHTTARHVYMGMAGLIYIDDAADTYDLPSEYGVNDIPLVVQDRQFFEDGTHPYIDESFSNRELMSGIKGEAILVNGAITPTYIVPQGLVRFRILNGSNARNYNFGMSDGRMMSHIASEGGLFEAPIQSKRILLAPGERAEVLVDFGSNSSGDRLKLRSFSGEVVDTLFSGRMGSRLSDDFDNSTFDVMYFEVGDPPQTPVTPPTQFAPIDRIDASAATQTRNIALSMQMGNVYINGAQLLDINAVPSAVNFSISEGTVEIWKVTNSSGMSHPLHIHNRHFQVLDINGREPPSELAGWKDTVLIKPDQEIRLLMSFDGTPDADFPYMFHCHILEHEDGGMMGQFFIV